MDVEQLDALVSYYFHASLTPTTSRSYDSAKRRYLKFCHASNILPLPATEDKLCNFAAYLADSSLTHQTIKCYLSAIRHLQISSNMGDPHISCMPKLEHVLRGIKNEQSKRAKETSKPRLSMTPSILLKFRSVWEENPGNYDHIMLWAACCTCYFGFLRSGEICSPSDRDYDSSTHLSYSDIAVDSHHNDPSTIAITIKASKTDPYRQGVTVYLGKTGSKLCPVKARLAFITVRGDAPGPLFKFENQQVLTRERFVTQVRSALSKAGLNPDAYAGHSFRIGAVTVAHEKGIEDSTIMTLGRWKSNAYQHYIRIPQEHLAHISAHVATPTAQGHVKTFHPLLDD